MRLLPSSGALIGAAAAAIAVVALAVLVAGSGDDEPPSGEQVWTREAFFGANAPILRDYATREGAASLDALAASMASAGLGWARIGIDQSVEQRDPDSADWSIPDAFVAALARHGIRTQALMFGTAAWAAGAERVAGCGLKSAPEDVDAWAEFVGDAVARYGRDGDFWREHPEIPALPIETWEIGNEQNTHVFWCPETDPERYAALYSAAREEALDSDPEALVIVGGLAPAFDGAGPGDLTVPLFLRRMVDAEPDLASEIPAVAIHPYASTPEAVLETVGRFREAMREARLGDTPMFVNEVGWYTRGAPGPLLASESDRAARIRELTSRAQLTGCGVVAFGIHAWLTYQQDPLNHEDWYGLADPVTGALNESGQAYGEEISRVLAEGAGSESTGSTCD